MTWFSPTRYRVSQLSLPMGTFALRLCLMSGAGLALLTASRVARADDSCPLGSTEKTEAGFTWCEPSVCDGAAACPPGSVCRPVPLCVEIGTLDAGSPGGARLLVRQRCGANKSCPQNTTCSEKDRCVTRAQADKAGLLVLTDAGAAPAAEGAAAPKKSACGCSTPGAHLGEGEGGVPALLALVALGARRRRAR